VEPKRCTIPPHEHRYVTAFFTPKAIASYTGVFEAEVEQGTDAATQLLQFELLGEGTLPHLTVQAPTAKTDRGQPLLQFTRLLVGRTKRMPVQLHNGGILAATVTVSMAGDDALVCSASGQRLTLEPKDTQVAYVTFKPVAAGEVEAAVHLSVANNAFEETAILVRGEAFVQDVAFEDIAEGESEGEVLNFADVEVGATKSLSFTVRNYSSTPRRFAWQSLPGLTFSPSVGHLQPGAVKQVIYK